LNGGEQPEYEFKRSESISREAGKDRYDFIKFIQGVANSDIPVEKCIIVGADPTKPNLPNLWEFLWDSEKSAVMTCPKPLKDMVSADGLEPSTHALKGLSKSKSTTCTEWATEGLSCTVLWLQGFRRANALEYNSVRFGAGHKNGHSLMG